MRLAEMGERDLVALLAIYNDVILSSTAVYSEAPVTIEERRAWFLARRADGFPVIGAFDGETLIAYGSFGQFRPWSGYATTVEHSVHVEAGHRGQGVGELLVRDLIERARSMNKHVMIAGIDSENGPSLALHAKLGFAEAGRLPQVARKFGRWLDLIYYHLELLPA